MFFVNKSSAVKFVTLLVALASTDASALSLGTYSFTSGKTSGTMVVTDISACKQRDSLGCMSAARPINVRIQTLNRETLSDCDVDATEDTVARVRVNGKVEAVFIIADERSKDKPNLLIRFDKAEAHVRPLEDGVGIGCGAGVDYAGRWRLKAKPR